MLHHGVMLGVMFYSWLDIIMLNNIMLNEISVWEVILEIELSCWRKNQRHNTQHNDTQYNDTQQNNIKACYEA